MKYALFGDIHGSELNDLEKFLDSEEIGALICTGDFDQTRSIHQFIELEKKILRGGGKVTVVPGNHDHALYVGDYIRSDEIRRQGGNSKELHEELRADPIASQYILDLLQGERRGFKGNRIKGILDLNKFGDFYRVMIVHGAPIGNMHSFPDCPDKIKNLWARLLTEDDHKEVFDYMDKSGYKIMIRGHDHSPIYSCRDENEIISFHLPNRDIVGYRLGKEKLHIVNPGALFDGSLATIDTNFPGEKVPILKYHKL